MHQNGRLTLEQSPRLHTLHLFNQIPLMNQPAAAQDRLNKGQGITLTQSFPLAPPGPSLCPAVRSFSLPHHLAWQLFLLDSSDTFKLSLVDLFSLYLSEGMPCLESMEAGSDTPGTSRASGAEESFRRETVTAPPMVRGMGWFFSPQWSPRSKTHRRRFGDGMKSDQVEAWLDDHSDFTRAYFLRRASA